MTNDPTSCANALGLPSASLGLELDTYREAAEIYRQACIAMGRIPVVQDSIGNTMEIRIPHGQHEYAPSV